MHEPFTGTALETVAAAIVAGKGDPSFRQIQEALAQLEAGARELAQLRLLVSA